MNVDIQFQLINGEVLKMKKRRKSFSRKLKTVESAVQIAVTVIVAAVTLYSLIPKNDKIKDVDTDALIENFTEKTEEEQSEALQNNI